MTFTRSRSPILWNYNISGLNILRIINDVVDLGFYLTRDLNPISYMAMVSGKAFKVLSSV